MTEYVVQDGVFPPVLIFLEWNIFGFTNSIDFVTNTLPYVGFSGSISFCYNSIYLLVQTLHKDTQNPHLHTAVSTLLHLFSFTQLLYTVADHPENTRKRSIAI